MPKRKFIQKAAKLLANKGQGRRSNLNPLKIYELASSSTASDYPDYEELLKIKIKKEGGDDR
jgi:hypothetical protein